MYIKKMSPLLSEKLQTLAQKCLHPDQKADVTGAELLELAREALHLESLTGRPQEQPDQTTNPSQDPQHTGQDQDPTTKEDPSGWAGPLGPSPARELTFTEYQALAFTTAMYPGYGEGKPSFPALALAAKAGEICEKVKKAVRYQDGKPCFNSRVVISNKIGDALWFLAALSSEIGWELGLSAHANLVRLKGYKNNPSAH